MTTLVSLQALFFNPGKKARENKLVASVAVSENQSQQDHCAVASLQDEILTRCEKELKLRTIPLKLSEEPRSTRCLYEDKGNAQFLNDALSVHHFTDESGTILRRVVILYPMSKGRQGELPKFQLLRKLEKALAAEGGCPIEVVDFRKFEEEGKFLEGLASMTFSHDANFVYMALSPVSDRDIFDAVCARDALNIPQKNRFVFTVAFPRLPSDKAKISDDEILNHTSLAGWCGKGICAWGFDLLRFASEEEQEAFYQHLEVTYQKIINLSVEEIRAFAGNAFEVAAPTGNGERRVLCIADSAFRALNYRSARILKEWYGEENIFLFYADAVHRRCGTSIRGLVSVPVVHGPVLPYADQESALEVARVHEKDAPPVIRR